MRSGYTVYVIKNPLNGMPVYVGRTERGNVRLKEHSTCNVSACCQWLKAMEILGLDPVVEVVSEHESLADAAQAECDVIDEFCFLGVVLLNRVNNMHRPPYSWSPLMADRRIRPHEKIEQLLKVQLFEIAARLLATKSPKDECAKSVNRATQPEKLPLVFSACITVGTV